MQHDEAASRRNFTVAAREAALARRRELAALPKDPVDRLRLYVTRGARVGNDFGWEIRRFGALVVARSAMGYATAELARHAGDDAIAAMAAG